MSRAFVNEDSQQSWPAIPERAPLPDGIPNYVTPRGKRLLEGEYERLEDERSRVEAAPDSDEKRLQTYLLKGRLAKLADRLASARVVDLSQQPRDEVRFGATVTIETLSGKRAGAVRRLQLVGVDEADAGEGRIAFIAPIARALLGKELGDSALFRAPTGAEELEIRAVSYSVGESP